MSQFFDADFPWRRMLQNAAGIMTDRPPQSEINEQLDKVPEVAPFM